MELRGQLLVASPHMGDTSFAKTVVLLLHHSDEGAFGVVLNRPIGETVRQLWEKVCQQPCPSDRLVNFGGPVSGPLMALHRNALLGELEVPPGVYLAADREHLEQLVQQTKSAFKLFIGHAGWGSGQLENELRLGAWLTTRATEDHIFGDHDDLWNEVVRQIGWSVMTSSLKIKHVPSDPAYN